jgi:hypothetical protein
VGTGVRASTPGPRASLASPAGSASSTRTEAAPAPGAGAAGAGAFFLGLVTAWRRGAGFTRGVTRAGPAAGLAVDLVDGLAAGLAEDLAAGLPAGRAPGCAPPPALGAAAFGALVPLVPRVFLDPIEAPPAPHGATRLLLRWPGRKRQAMEGPREGQARIAQEAAPAAGTEGATGPGASAPPPSRREAAPRTSRPRPGRR